MGIEGAIIGYTGILALSLQRVAVANSPAGLTSHCGAALLVGVCAVVAFQYSGAYQLATRRPSEHVKRTLSAWLSLATGLLVLAPALALDRHFASSWAVLWLTFATAGLTIERCLVSLWFTRLNERKLVRHRVVIVPAFKSSLLLEQSLVASGTLGLEVVGFADDRPVDSLPACFPRKRVIGDIRALISLIRNGEVDEVVIAMPWTAAAAIQRLLVLLTETPVRVSLATGPVIHDLPIRCVADLGGMPVVRLSDRPIAGFGRLVKKLEDIVLGSLMLAISLPLLIIVALAIKLDSPGPVLFCQPRVGFNGRAFPVLKFRTMHVTATDIAGTRQAVRNDPRVTRVGAWLRRTSIDELPQLVNVLHGEMSLVGPRPHAHGTTVEGRLLHDAISRYAARHRVKPGITGWAQINGWRGETDVTIKLEERLRHDLFYIDNWSLWLDCVILVRTVFELLRQRNAY